jgi:ribose transport system substrate-binding protein
MPPTFPSSSRPLRARLLGAVLLLLALPLLVAACGSDEEASGGGGDGGDKLQIGLIQSYSGNDWQNSAANLVKAVAATPPYSGTVELSHQIAGTDPQKQSKLITDEVSAGADALVLYPVSPTAINTAVRKACDQGVTVVSYDSWTTEPCSYNIISSGRDLAEARVTWLADHLKGKGQIAEIIGVAGTAFDTIHQEEVDRSLEDYPGIEMVAREEGFWSQPGARDAITKIVSAHPDLDGFIAQVGCWGATEKLLDEGHEPLPCAGADSMGHLRMMLPKGEDPAAIGLPSVAATINTYIGALAFMQAVELVEGGEEAAEERCHETINDPKVWTNADLQVGTDPTKPGTVFPSDSSPNVPPGVVADFYSPLVGQGVNAVLTGKSDQIAEPTGPVKARGDDTIDGLAEGDGRNCTLP